jgi:hypothetical protein
MAELSDIRKTHRVHEHAAAAVIRAYMPADAACCDATMLTTCCEPSAKSDCCGSAAAEEPPTSCSCA